MRIVLRLVLLISSGLLLWIAYWDGNAAPMRTSEQAYFKFDIPPYPETFVFLLTDPEKIETARAMLSGILPSQHIMGTIVKQPATYNPPWNYYLDPGTITFFNYAIEVCDETIVSIETHLDEVCVNLLPGCIWCPWGSRLIEEVPPAEVVTPQQYLPLIHR